MKRIHPLSAEFGRGGDKPFLDLCALVFVQVLVPAHFRIQLYPGIARMACSMHISAGSDHPRKGGGEGTRGRVGGGRDRDGETEETEVLDTRC